MPSSAQMLSAGAGDVGRAEVDVVGARQAVLEDGLLEAVLLLGRALREGEVAVGDEARGAVDLREQVGLAQLSHRGR